MVLKCLIILSLNLCLVIEAQWDNKAEEIRAVCSVPAIPGCLTYVRCVQRSTITKFLSTHSMGIQGDSKCKVSLLSLWRSWGANGPEKPHSAIKSESALNAERRLCFLRKMKLLGTLSCPLSLVFLSCNSQPFSLKIMTVRKWEIQQLIVPFLFSPSLVINKLKVMFAEHTNVQR